MLTNFGPVAFSSDKNEGERWHFFLILDFVVEKQKGNAGGFCRFSVLVVLFLSDCDLSFVVTIVYV